MLTIQIVHLLQNTLDEFDNPSTKAQPQVAQTERNASATPRNLPSSCPSNPNIICITAISTYEFTVPPTGARVYAENSLRILNEYCSSLNGSKPTFAEIEASPGAIPRFLRNCSVAFPVLHKYSELVQYEVHCSFDTPQSQRTARRVTAVYAVGTAT